jgi:carboxyl-terminal processing protease
VSRFTNGELEVADSNKFADSLRFATPGGRIVYGGGGIMPDVFVPIDTVGVSDYFIEVRNRGLIYSFSLNYSDEHRNELSALSTPEEFVSFLKKQIVLQKFISFAASEGVKGSAGDIRTSQRLLEVQICAYIARNFIDNRGFYPVIREIDKTILVAIEEFRD